MQDVYMTKSFKVENDGHCISLLKNNVTSESDTGGQ